ncbi:hypothetical protein KXV85_001005, partial [Aspergillus fumigatus]
APPVSSGHSACGRIPHHRQQSGRTVRARAEAARGGDPLLSLRREGTDQGDHDQGLGVQARAGEICPVPRLSCSGRPGRPDTAAAIFRGERRDQRSAARPPDLRRLAGLRDTLCTGMARGHVRDLGDRSGGRRCRTAAVRDTHAGHGSKRMPSGRMARIQSNVPGVRRRRGLHSREDPSTRRTRALPALPALDAPLQPSVGCALSQCLGRARPQLSDRLSRGRLGHTTRDRSFPCAAGRPCLDHGRRRHRAGP